MNQKYETVTMALFGCSVVASGLWRYFSAAGGNAGLWFGLVMGVLALLAAWFFYSSKPIVGHAFAWIAILFVGGWFCYESFVKKGIENAEPRQLIIIGITFAAAGWMISTALRGKFADSGDGTG